MAEGLLLVAEMIAGIGAAAKGAAKDLSEAASAAAAYSAASSTTSGMPTPAGGSTTSIGSTSLGDPRNAEDQAARIHAAIEAAKRR